MAALACSSFDGFSIRGVLLELSTYPCDSWSMIKKCKRKNKLEIINENKWEGEYGHPQVKCISRNKKKY